MKRWLIPIVCVCLCSFLLSWERTAFAVLATTTSVQRADDGTMYQLVRVSGAAAGETTRITTIFGTAGNGTADSTASQSCSVANQIVKAASGVPGADPAGILGIGTVHHTGIINNMPANFAFDPIGSGRFCEDNGAGGGIANDGICQAGEPTIGQGCPSAVCDLDTVGGCGGVSQGFTVTYHDPFDLDGVDDPPNVEDDDLIAYTFNGGAAPTVQQDVSGGCPAWPGDGVQLSNLQGIILCWDPVPCTQGLEAGIASIDTFTDVGGERFGNAVNLALSHSDQDPAGCRVTGCEFECFTEQVAGGVLLHIFDTDPNNPLACCDTTVQVQLSANRCINVGAGQEIPPPLPDPTDCRHIFYPVQCAGACGPGSDNTITFIVRGDKNGDGIDEEEICTHCWPCVECEDPASSGIAHVVGCPDCTGLSVTAVSDSPNCLTVTGPPIQIGCDFTFPIAKHFEDGVECEGLNGEDCTGATHITYTLVDNATGIQKDSDTCDDTCRVRVPALSDLGVWIFALLLVGAGIYLVNRRRHRLAE